MAHTIQAEAKQRFAIDARYAASILALGIAVLLSACNRVQSVTLTGATMGTTYTVKMARLPAGVDPDRLAADIDSKLAEINGLMSNYQADSEISRFNASRETDWFAVAPETLTVLRRAMEVSEATGGAFDVTVGPLVRLWNFGPGRTAVDRLVSDEEIAAVQGRIGFEKIQLRDNPPAIRKVQDDLEIDLSAVAKGFAVDEVANLLRAQAISDFMVEIGGEVQTGGVNDRGRPWNIAIEAPVAGVRQIQQVIPLTEMALATSGDYRNFFEIDGRRYSHILDPRTGRPVEHKLLSASVLHPSCTVADAWATALLVLGPDEGFAVAQRDGLAVLLIVEGENGFVERATEAFKKRAEQQP